MIACVALLQQKVVWQSTSWLFFLLRWGQQTIVVDLPRCLGEQTYQLPPTCLSVAMEIVQDPLMDWAVEVWSHWYLHQWFNCSFIKSSISTPYSLMTSYILQLIFICSSVTCWHKIQTNPNNDQVYKYKWVYPSSILHVRWSSTKYVVANW